LAGVESVNDCRRSLCFAASFIVTRRQLARKADVAKTNSRRQRTNCLSFSERMIPAKQERICRRRLAYCNSDSVESATITSRFSDQQWLSLTS